MILPSETKAIEAFVAECGEDSQEIKEILKDLSKSVYVPTFLANISEDCGCNSFEDIRACFLVAEVCPED